MLSAFVREIAVAVYVIAFSALSIRALVDWRRDRDRSAGWFAATFGSLAVVVLASSLVELSGVAEPPTAFSRVIIVLLAVYPLALLHFAATFGGIGWLERRAVAVASAGLMIATIVLPDLPKEGETPTDAFAVFSLVFVIVWAVVSARVAAHLWVAGRPRVTIVRRRMRLLATGIALLTAALLLQAVAPGNWALGIALLAAVSAMFSYAGFAPPEWLRGILRQADQQRLRVAVTGLVAASSEREVRDTLLPIVRDLIGVHGVAILHPELDEAMVTGYTDEELGAIQDSVQGLELADGETIVIDHRYVGRRGAAIVVLDTPRGGEFFGVGELELVASIAAIVTIALSRIRDSKRVVEREQQLREALDMAELGSWEWDIARNEVSWTARMHEIFGTDVDEPLSYERYRSLLAPEDRDVIGRHVEEAIATGTSYAVDHRVVRPDGDERFVHSRGRVVVDDDGKPVRICGVTQDVTARVYTEQTLRDAVEAEREIASRLRAVDELKSSILAAVSHELRTPLTSVHGFAILLQDRVEELDPAQRKEILGHLVAEAVRLERLLSDLLDIDRLRRGAIDPNLVMTDVSQLVRDMVASRERHDRILVDIEPVECQVDAPKLERIVENLLVNAEKHTESGSPIWVHVRAAGPGVELRVEDDGPGVPAELREDIFEPFNRGGELGHAPGTGIGLSLVAQFTRLHGGHAWVEERRGGGAAFVVTLPGVDVAHPSGAQTRTTPVGE